jgi:hypothetical protein
MVTKMPIKTLLKRLEVQRRIQVGAVFPNASYKFSERDRTAKRNKTKPASAANTISNMLVEVMGN